MPYTDTDNKRRWDRNKRRQQTADKQEIGPPPKRKNSARWKRACNDFRCFCENYKKEAFDLKWAADHLQVFELCKHAIDEALMYALAMPRGSGKTAIFEALVEWVILSGRKQFALLVAATGTKADELMVKIKTSFTQNAKLQGDFAPELYGIVALDNEARRCDGQKCNGAKTGVKWLKNRIVMPTVPGSLCGGAVIVTAGILGAINGLQHTKFDGRIVRPDIALIDDPQTLDSAISPIKSKKRIDVLHQSIRGLAGPKRGISIVLACTKMYENDLACQILDGKKYPQWTAHVFKMLLEWPKEMKLWDEYWNIRIGPGDAKRNATRFYQKNRVPMDEGARMYWPDRFREDEREVSGIQHMMNLYYENSHVFWSEYQNEPQGEGTNIFRMAPRAHVDDLCVDNFEGTIPDTTYIVVAHIDIHQNIHYGTAAAFARDSTMRKCWHGTFPHQGRLYFEQSRPPVAIERREGDAPVIDELTKAIRFLARAKWTKSNGVNLPTTIITIDFRWMPQYTLSAMANSGYGAMCMPYMGMPISPDQKPLKEYMLRSPSDTKGDFWYLDTDNEYLVPLIKVDVNAMKERLHSKLLIDSGKIGSVSFCGGPPQTASSINWNSMLIDHLFSKEPAFREGKRTLRTKLQFIDKDGRPDDHYFDCLVANLTMADVYGCRVINRPQHLQPLKQPQQVVESGSSRVQYVPPF